MIIQFSPKETEKTVMNQFSLFAKMSQRIKNQNLKLFDCFSIDVHSTISILLRSFFSDRHFSVANRILFDWFHHRSRCWSSIEVRSLSGNSSRDDRDPENCLTFLWESNRNEIVRSSFSSSFRSTWKRRNGYLAIRCNGNVKMFASPNVPIPELRLFAF